MKTTIPELEKAITGEIKTVEELGMNLTLFWAYKKSKYAGNDIINFYDVIWNKDINEIAKNLKENGVNEFSISSNLSGLITTLAEFEKHGVTMAGIILGRPVEYSEFMPDAETGCKPIAFGDLSYYWIVERQFAMVKFCRNFLSRMDLSVISLMSVLTVNSYALKRSKPLKSNKL